MSGSVLVLLAKVGFSAYEADFEILRISSLTIITGISFFLFHGRLYFGDSNFNNALGDFGLNTIFHSSSFFLRHKRILDAIVLSTQGVGFILLASFINTPLMYFGLFCLVMTINICWLLLQSYCFTVYKKCILSKFENSQDGYSKSKFLGKAKKLNRLSILIHIWLFNNVFFSLFFIFIYFCYLNFGDFAIVIALFLTISNSLIDFILTGRFYSQPESFVSI